MTRLSTKRGGEAYTVVVGWGGPRQKSRVLYKFADKSFRKGPFSSNFFSTQTKHLFLVPDEVKQGNVRSKQESRTEVDRFDIRTPWRPSSEVDPGYSDHRHTDPHAAQESMVPRVSERDPTSFPQFLYGRRLQLLRRQQTVPVGNETYSSRARR
jgi:hypothetical protein